MPRKARSDNYDALGSIFDFIFSEAKKPYGKRRSIPAKTGISGEDAFTDALAFTLERPGAIMSDSVVNELNDALNLELTAVKFDEGGKLSISTGGIIDLIKDPKGFVDKAITRNKGMRKATRAKFLGENIEDFVTTAWAYKFGDLEVKAATRGMIVVNHSSESYKVRRALGQYSRTHKDEKSQILSVPIPGATYANDLDYMADRSLELLGRRTFLSNWDTMSDIEKNDFTEKVSGGVSQLEVQQYLEREYSSTEAGRFALTTGLSPDKEIDVFKPDLYKSLESQNLADRIRSLSGATPGSAQEDEKRMYEKTLLLLNRNRVDLRKQLSDLNTEYRSATTSARKNELQKQIKDTKGALRSLDGSTLFGQIGKWEGYVNSLKMVYGPAGTNIAASIINGDFFDDRKNTVFNPVEKGGKYGGVEIVVAKKLKTPNGNDKTVLNLYNKMGESLYYMTPRSLFRTFFFNGEGFARLLKTQEEKLLSFSGMSVLSSIGLNTGDVFNKINSDKIADLDIVVKDALARASSVLSPDQYLQLERILKNSKNLRKLVNLFSLPSQAISKIKGAIEVVINKNLKKLRVKIAKYLLKNPRIRAYLVKSGATKLLGKWIAGAGLKVGIKALITTIAAAVGLVGTPIASFVISVGTWIATDLLMKAVGDLLSILKYVSIGILAFIIISGSGALSVFNKRNYSYSNTTPGGVDICQEYGIGPIIGPINPGDPGYVTNCKEGESVQEIYSRLAGEMGISTKLELVMCPGHIQCTNISWAWCYSSSSIFCKADKIGGASCPVVEALFTHELIHQIQGRNAGGTYGRDFREWGADYLSQNGGGYTFLTSDGCVRATQVSIPSSCDRNTLTAIAQSEGWAYETDCRRALSNVIKKICPR